MKKFVADLHIHTCLSPCAELDMTPRRIIDAAVDRGLDIIAITDHNSAENTGIAVKIGRERGITVLPSMEVTSYEEAHILALFGSMENIIKLQEIIYGSLSGVNDAKAFGYQLKVNEDDEILEFNDRLLIGATNLFVKDTVNIIRSLGGLAVASHIDRGSFSVLSQLGFIPNGVRFDALDISYNTEIRQAESIFSGYRHIPLITSSDAHHLDDIGRRTTSFFLEEASFDEIERAFRGERKIEWG